MGSDLAQTNKTDIAKQISIHAPRMGSDMILFSVTAIIMEFQSTLPGWGATKLGVSDSCGDVFQSTLPGWGATAKMDIFAHDMGKIIHFQH